MTAANRSLSNSGPVEVLRLGSRCPLHWLTSSLLLLTEGVAHTGTDTLSLAPLLAVISAWRHVGLRIRKGQGLPHHCIPIDINGLYEEP